MCCNAVITIVKMFICYTSTFDDCIILELVGIGAVTYCISVIATQTILSRPTDINTDTGSN